MMKLIKSILVAVALMFILPISANASHRYYHFAYNRTEYVRYCKISSRYNQRSQATMKRFNYKKQNRNYQKGMQNAFSDYFNAKLKRNSDYASGYLDALTYFRNPKATKVSVQAEREYMMNLKYGCPTETVQDQLKQEAHINEL